MSQARMLLANLNDPTPIAEGGGVTDCVVIDNDRYITVPDSLKRLGVQHDHDIQTVTIDGPRYWDGHDMSQMKIYVNYMCANGMKGKYLTQNLQVGTDRMTFDWTISGNVTQAKGRISFLVCIVTLNDDGTEKLHWNSELNQDCTISEGMECEEIALVQYPDIITQLLLRMDEAERVANPEAIATAIETALREAKENGEFDGARGPQGPQGEKGETGEVGPQGPQGEKGETASADFSENDPTESGYIKNRTHWLEPVSIFVEWDGNTIGLREYSPNPLGPTYYKISDICPEDEDILGAIITMSNGDNITVTQKHFTGFTDGVAKIGAYMYAIKAPQISQGNVIDYNVIGLYATAGNTGAYPAMFTNSRIAVHTLDEKFIPESIARKDDLTQAVADYFSKNPDVVPGSGLPSVDASHEGMFLKIENGAPVWRPMAIPEQYGLISYDQDKTITIT